MQSENQLPPIGLLLSGGLDSCILLGHLLREGRRVQPFYVSSQLAWQREELLALERFLEVVGTPQVQRLVLLEMPLRDVYEEHWSITGRGVPDAATADDSVYLPGRNVLLLVKAALWCALHGIDQLALAVLGSNPFSDATAEFFHDLQATLNRATGARLDILRPFAELEKRQVMQLGRGLPLHLTFSCIAPLGGLHCGQCNKCAERKTAFCGSGMEDPTVYANQRGSVRPESLSPTTTNDERMTKCSESRAKSTSATVTDC